MNTATITVGSVTYALKVKKSLEREGIRATLVKVDSSKSKNGCTYGIKISNNNFYDAISVLRNYGIEYSVYNDK